VRLLLLPAEEANGSTDFLMRTYRKEELADLVLKKNEQGDGTYAYYAVEERSEQTHLKNLRNENPKDYEHEHAKEDVQRAGFLHKAVAVVEENSYEKDIENVFNAYGEEHGSESLGMSIYMNEYSTCI